MSSDNNKQRKQHIKSVVRVRPLLPYEIDIANERSCVDISDKGTSLVLTPSNNFPREFNFPCILSPECSQTDVFDRCGVKELLRAAMHGYAVTIMAYGQTGSGKTYTMSGAEDILLKNSDQNGIINSTDGIIPRSIRMLFDLVARRTPESADSTRGGSSNKSATNDIKATFCEIYNEKIADLLSDKAGSREAQNLPLRSQAERGFYVEGLVRHCCLNADELLDTLRQGLENRHVASHNLNKDSSRSHSLLTLYIDAPGHKQGKVTFVDLAGSERLKATNREDEQGLKETQHINKSLFVLGQVVAQLSDRASGDGGRHIAYRNSKLTSLLRDSLGGKAMCIMLTCVAPNSTFADESLHSLNYAMRAQNIQNRPVVGYVAGSDKDRLIHAMKEEVRRLRDQNAAYRQKFGGVTPKTSLQLPPISGRRNGSRTGSRNGSIRNGSVNGSRRDSKTTNGSNRADSVPATMSAVRRQVSTPTTHTFGYGRSSPRPGSEPGSQRGDTNVLVGYADIHLRGSSRGRSRDGSRGGSVIGSRINNRLDNRVPGRRQRSNHYSADQSSFLPPIDQHSHRSKLSSGSSKVTPGRRTRNTVRRNVPSVFASEHSQARDEPNYFDSPPRPPRETRNALGLPNGRGPSPVSPSPTNLTSLSPSPERRQQRKEQVPAEDSYLISPSPRASPAPAADLSNHEFNAHHDISAFSHQETIVPLSNSPVPPPTIPDPHDAWMSQASPSPSPVSFIDHGEPYSPTVTNLSVAPESVAKESSRIHAEVNGEGGWMVPIITTISPEETSNTNNFQLVESGRGTRNRANSNQTNNPFEMGVNAGVAAAETVLHSLSRNGTRKKPTSANRSRNSSQQSHANMNGLNSNSQSSNERVYTASTLSYQAMSNLRANQSSQPPIPAIQEDRPLSEEHMTAQTQSYGIPTQIPYRELSMQSDVRVFDGPSPDSEDYIQSMHEKVHPSQVDGFVMFNGKPTPWLSPPRIPSLAPGSVRQSAKKMARDIFKDMEKSWKHEGQDKNAAFEFEFPNADGDFVKSEQAQQREQDRQQRSEERLSPRKVDTPETDMDRLTRHLQQRQRQLDEEDRIFDGDQFDDFDQDRFSAYPDTHADTLNSPGKSIAPSYAGLLGRDSMETEQLSQLREITEHAMRQASLIQERLSVEGSPRSRHHMAPSPPPIPFPKNIPPRHRQHKAKSSAPSVIAQAVEGLPSGLGSLPLMEQDELHMAYPAEAGEFSLPLASVHASDISFGLGGMPDESRRSSGLGQQVPFSPKSTDLAKMDLALGSLNSIVERLKMRPPPPAISPYFTPDASPPDQPANVHHPYNAHLNYHRERDFSVDSLE